MFCCLQAKHEKSQACDGMDDIWYHDYGFYDTRYDKNDRYNEAWEHGYDQEDTCDHHGEHDNDSIVSCGCNDT